MGFYDDVKETLLNGENNISITENGAIGYKTTGKNILDVNFKASSFRNMSEANIIKEFEKAFYENKEIALKWLFYLRDRNEGMGERRTFRILMKWIAKSYPDEISNVIKYIPEYGRFDDIFSIVYENGIAFNEKFESAMISFIENQLKEDMENMNNDKPISLLAKWMPSSNTSSKEKRELAHILIKKLGTTESRYRKMLSNLRRYIDVTERKMCEKRWGEIDYEKVPSKANLIYNKAFFKHDEERRKKYIEELGSGTKKINASVLFPHDIVHKYCNSRGYWGFGVSDSIDETIEQLWKALPKKEIEDTIVVDDGSGSMAVSVGGTNVTANQIANALAIYFSENSKGGFKDKFITFGNSPRLVDLSRADSLREKIAITESNTDCSNTDIYKTFKLIIDTAIAKNMKNEDIPRNVLIISDMEFDRAHNNGYGDRAMDSLFEKIKREFNRHGYDLPRLVFWNVCSRTNTIPMKENKNGVVLVSGFSTNNVKMIMDGETDPYKCLLKTLMSERYEKIKFSKKSS